MYLTTVGLRPDLFLFQISIAFFLKFVTIPGFYQLFNLVILLNHKVNVNEKYKFKDKC